VAGDLIADYARRLGARLPDTTAAACAVEEVEDGLRCAVEDHVARGIDPHRAAELAVAEFGDADALAAGFRPVLAAAAAHRGGLALLATGPVVGGLWLAAAVLAWHSAAVAVTAGLAGAGLALLVAVPRLAYGVAGTGRLGHRLRTSPATAVRAVTGAARTAVALDAVLVLVALPGLVLAARLPAVTAAAAAAALLSLTRLGLTARWLTAAGRH
jgi:hypothetical protein